MKLCKFAMYSIVISLTTLFLAGCAAMNTDLRTIDNLPDNTPRAYVDFYTEENEDAIELHKKFPGTFSIFKVENGVDTEIKEMVWSWRTKRRITVKPGSHTFRVKFASAEITVNVEAIEAMIVPVRFTYNLGESNYYYQVGTGTMHKQYFNMISSIEKAIPYSGVSKK